MVSGSKFDKYHISESWFVNRESFFVNRLNHSRFTLLLTLFLLTAYSLLPAPYSYSAISYPDQAGQHASLKLDYYGNPRLSYFDPDTNDLKYAYWDGNQWIKSTVESDGIVGEFSSLALDPADNPRISYYHQTDSANEVVGALKYAYCNGTCAGQSQWTTVTVDQVSGGDVGGYTSLVLDNLGRPRIAYYDFVNGYLKFAYCNAGCNSSSNWTKVIVDTTGGRYADLALTLAGEAMISYYSEGLDEVRFAYSTSLSSWTTRQIDTQGGCCSTSIAVDPVTGRRMMTYQSNNVADYDLYYAYCDSNCDTTGQWTKVQIDSNQFTGYYSSIALSPVTSLPRIAFYYFGYYETRTVSGYTVPNIPWGGEIKLTGQGGGNNYGVSQSDVGNLYYISCNDASCSSYTTNSIDISNDAGHFSSLVMDSNDNPVIGYYDFIEDRLKVYAAQGYTGGSVVTVEAIASDASSGGAGVQAGDKVILGFSGETNCAVIDSSNIDTVLSLSNNHTWLDGGGSIGSAVWGNGSYSCDTLTITLSDTNGIPDVAVGDTICIDGSIVKDSGGIGIFDCGEIGGSFGTYISGMVLYLELNENGGDPTAGDGYDVYDSSGNSNHGTLGATGEVLEGSDPAWATGVSGSGLSFDGQDDYVEVGDDTTLKPLSGITIEAWVSTTDDVGTQAVLSKAEGSGYSLYLWRGSPNSGCNAGEVCAFFYNGSGYTVVRAPLTLIPLNTYHHVVATLDVGNGIAALYVDGVQVDTALFSGIFGHGAQPLCIGAEAQASDCIGGSNLTGVIDEVIIYDHALTSLEVQRDYLRYGSGIVSITADDSSGGGVGLQSGDRVTILFNTGTNAPSIDPVNATIGGVDIDVVLGIGGKTWKDGSGGIGSNSTWATTTYPNDTLIIELVGNNGLPTVDVGDTVTLDGVTIENRFGDGIAGSKVIGGSFGIPSSMVVHTTDTDFSAGTLSNTVVVDTGVSASVELGCSICGDGSEGDVVIDSDTVLSGEHNYRSLWIKPGVTVTAGGTTPLIIRSRGDVIIDGVIIADGGDAVNDTGGTGVAGGYDGGGGGPAGGTGSGGRGIGQDGGGPGGGQRAGGQWCNQRGGGGGGGFGSAGSDGTGSSCEPNGTGGGVYGDSALTTLVGGSGGGGGGCLNNCPAGGGGAGGGAIGIYSGTRVIIGQAGVLRADGGNGGGPVTDGGGGGGSGGAVKIDAPQVEHHGVISVVGGTGGQGWGGSANGGNGGGGRVRIDADTLTVTGSVGTGGGTYTQGSYTGGFALNGTIESSTIDLGTPAKFTYIFWNPPAQPSGTSLKVLLATSNCLNGADNPPTCDTGGWTFYGPSGTSPFSDADVFSGVFTDVYIDCTAGVPCPIWSGHTGYRYLRYKAYLSTNDPLITPRLDDISIGYEIVALGFSPDTGFDGVDGVDPDTGDLTTSFTYKVVYTDPSNQAPASIDVYIDGTAYPMSLDTGCGNPLLCDGDYTNGEQYLYTPHAFSTYNPHNYYFLADRAGYIVTLPETGVLNGPLVIELAPSAPTLVYSMEAGYVTNGVEPDTGITGVTIFTYKVVYTDLNNDPPSDIEVFIDGNPFVMVVDTGAVDPILRDGNYANGEQFIYQTQFSMPGTKGYYFYADDGVTGSFRLPASGEMSGPLVSDTPVVSYEGITHTTDIDFTNGGVMGLWHLNSVTSGQVSDASGNNHTGTLGDPTVGDMAEPALDTTNQILGAGALWFDGQDDYVSIGDIGSGVKTVEFWINDSNPNDGILELDNGIYVAIANGSITTTGFTSPTIYVNGIASGSLNAGWNHVVITDTTGIAGSNVTLGVANGDYMGGLLDEVVIYDRELSGSEIQGRYNGGIGVELQVINSVLTGTMITGVGNSGSIRLDCSAECGDGSEGDVVIDSDTVLSGEHNYRSLWIKPGVTVTAGGTTPLIIRSQGDVIIDGVIIADGGDAVNDAGGTGVAGGYDGGGGGPAGGTGGGGRGIGQNGGGPGGGQRAGGSWCNDRGGGGGGGFGSAGSDGTGSSCEPNGTGGVVYGDSALTTLVGGSGGGGGGCNFNCPAGGGGAGGGAIGIYSGTRVVIGQAGVLRADGGNGGGPVTDGGGGGGSGGAVKIEAPQVEHHGVISVVGGVGGQGSGDGGNGGGGRVRIDADTLTVTGSVGTGGGTYTQGSYTSSATQGIYESAVIDFGAIADFTFISWNPVTQPQGTALKVLLATSNCLNGADNPPTCDTGGWTFYGPGWTSPNSDTDVFTGVFTDVYSGCTVSLPCEINANHNGSRYLRYKVYLTTNNPAITPALDDITIGYKVVVLTFSPDPGFDGVDGIDPNIGDTSTLFTYKVVYTSVSGQAPVSIEVYIDGTPYPMSLDTGCGDPLLCDGDYTNGEQYIYTRTFSTLTPHSYYFVADSTVYLPQTGVLNGPTVTGGAPQSPVLTYSVETGYNDGLEPIDEVGVEPDTGYNGSTLFSFKVVYEDANNEPPVSVEVVIDGVSYAMTRDTLSVDPTLRDLNYINKEQFVYTTTFSTYGTRSYYFRATDDGQTYVELPSSQTPLTGPSVNPTDPPAPLVIAPDRGQRGDTLGFTIDGYNFMDMPVPSISFVGPGGITNPGIDVVAGVVLSSITPPPNCPDCTQRLSTTIRIDPFIDNAYVGGWDVVVTNPDTQQTTMVRAFQVEMSMPAPSQVTDLVEVSRDCSAGSTCDVTLTWTPPVTGTSYDVRYSLSLIDDTNWTSATQVPGSPLSGLTVPPVVVTLTNNNRWYVGLKAYNQVYDSSPLSNIVQVDLGDVTPPNPITDLTAAPASGISGETTISLTWTAPSDDVLVSQYDIRYSTTPILNDTDFAGAVQVTGEPVPQAPGSLEQMDVGGLMANTTYYFAIKGIDSSLHSSSLNTGIFNCDGDNDQVNDSVCATTAIYPPDPIADLRAGQIITTTVFQTSDDGSLDTPDAGGFNAGVKTNTVVSGTGEGASVRLSGIDTTGMVGLWHMDNDWTDAVGSNNGSPSGATFTTASKVGSHAGNFDGNNKVTIGTTNRPTNNFTIEAWVRTTVTHQIDGESTNSTSGVSGQRYVFGAKYMSDGNPNCNCSTISGAGVSIGTNGISVYEHSSYYMPPLAVYQGNIGTGWNHVVIVYDNRRPYIYLNGNLVRTGLQSPKATVYAPIEFGGGSYGYHVGQMDEVAIYNRALLPQEVLEHYNWTNAGNELSSYLPSGTFESAVIDLGAQSNFNTISWNPVIQPDLTDVGIQIATSNSPAGPWTYLGPDGQQHTDCSQTGYCYKSFLDPASDNFDTGIGSAWSQSTVYDTTGTASILATGGAVELYADSDGSGSSSSYNYARLSQVDLSYLTGDFDIQIDYTILNYHTSTPQYNVYMRMVVGYPATGNGDNYTFVEHYVDIGGNKIRGCIRIDGAISCNSVSVGNLSGRFRIVRKGGNQYTYYTSNSVSGWVLLKSDTTGSATAPVTGMNFTTYVQRNNAVTMRASIDNYEVWGNRQAIGSGHNGSQYLRYKAYLTTQDTTVTPQLDDISIETDTEVVNPSDTSIGLIWTATGDNGSVGQAGSYDLRMSLSPILTDTDFNNATQVTGLPTPEPAGSRESIVIGSLDPDTTYYFAIKAIDGAGAVSAINTGVYGCSADPTALSTCVKTALSGVDNIPPNAVTDLGIGMLSDGNLELRWTAPGDDGMIINGGPVSSYDVRYFSCSPTPCTVTITDATWNTGQQLQGVPSPPSAMGSQESFQFTLPPPTQTVSYYFALRSTDDAQNISDISNIVQWTPTVIDTNTTWSGGQYSYDELYILSGVTLTLNSPVTTINASRVVVDGTINATGKGCQGGIGGSSNAYGWDGQNCVENGTGFGGAASGSTSASVWGGGGGGHGGNGGDGYTSLGAYGGASYGSMVSPVEPGAGGGWSVLSCCWTYVNGGSGGGAIQMNISGPLTVNGQILANGTNGQLNGGCSNYRYGGGGAGGSIYITTGSIAGSGVIQAKGGNGATSCGGGGGGAGGRVAIYASQSATFPEGNISVAGGSGNGESGTVQYLYPIPDPPVVDNYPTTDLIISSDTTWPPTWGWGTYIYNNITIDPGVTLTINGRVTIEAKGDFTNNGTISADGKGCGAETGPDGYGSINCVVGAPGAAGVVTTYGKDGGGGYGGKGGGDSSHDPGEPYGYAVQPVDLGSGGGNNYWQGQVNSYGGRGGGAIKIKVAGTMRNYGIISANGADQGTGGQQQGNGGAGGSGGSIWVIATDLDGRGGIFRAEGGEYGAGGGGGRIALEIANNITSTGALSCKGGRSLVWPDAGDGQDGTCYVVPLVDIAGITPAAVPQGITNYPVVITGSGFTPGVNTVSFGGAGVSVNSTIVDSDTQLTVYISVASNASVGVMDVTVANSIRGSDTLSGLFAVNPAPTVTSVSPTVGAQGDILTLGISGNYFVDGATVSISGSGVNVLFTTVNSATSITAQISIDATASVGDRNVVVTNPDGGIGVLSGGFTIVD